VPRPLSLVKVVTEGWSAADRRRYPFKEGRAYLFLGEIPNMPEHCVLVDWERNRTYVGYHTENFIELTRDEM
jgi:hypothetical protein